jgi:hypothetical protein
MSGKKNEVPRVSGPTPPLVLQSVSTSWPRVWSAATAGLMTPFMRAGTAQNPTHSQLR